MNQMFNRYAIALFSLALESNKIDEYLKNNGAEKVYCLCLARTPIGIPVD